MKRLGFFLFVVVAVGSLSGGFSQGSVAFGATGAFVSTANTHCTTPNGKHFYRPAAPARRAPSSYMNAARKSRSRRVSHFQQRVPNPAEALAWPAEDRSPCKGRLERTWEKAVAAAKVIATVADECADYFSNRQQVYIDAVARFAPIQPPQVGLTLLAEELTSKVGKHATRCVLRGLVTGTVSPGASRDAAIKTIDAIGEYNDLTGDIKKATSIVEGLWRSRGVDTFQQDLGKARFAGLLDLKARDRFEKGPKKYKSLFDSIRKLFQDEESRSRESYAEAKESARSCNFKDAYALYDTATLDALHVLNELRLAIRTDQAELRCDLESGGSSDTAALKVSIQQGMEEHARLSSYIHEIANEKAAAQEEEKRVADWKDRRKAAMKDAEATINARDFSNADSKLRHLENVFFKVCPDELEWQQFLALRRKLYDAQSQKSSQVLDISGTWNVVIIDPRNGTSQLRWELRKDIQPGIPGYNAWGIKQTLLQTTDRARQKSIGETWESGTMELASKTGGKPAWSYRGSTVVGSSQIADLCDLQRDSFKCEGIESFNDARGSQYSITIKGSRAGGGNASAETSGPYRSSAPNPVEILEVVGEVEISPGGDDSKARALRAGDSVGQSDRIVTSMDAQAKLRFPDGSIVVVGELTDMKVAVFNDVGQEVQTRIWMMGGRIAAEVNKVNERPSDFSVKTPTNSGGVKGHHASDIDRGLEVQAVRTADSITRFTVSYEKQSGITRIVVAEGSVRITPDGLKSFFLEANGQMAVAPYNKMGPISGITTTENNTPRGGSAGSITGGFTRRDNMSISPPAKILRYFGSPSEDACKSSCAGDRGCVAYTFVRPGGYQAGDPPMCYLMSSLGPQVEHSCCVSGFKAGDSASNRAAP